MLRILIRLYLIVAILLLISIVFVQRSFPYIFSTGFMSQTHRAYTNEAVLLREYLGPIQDSAQQARLDRMERMNPQRYRRLSATGNSLHFNSSSRIVQPWCITVVWEPPPGH